MDVTEGMNLNEAERQALNDIMSRKMIQDMTRFVNNVTQECFDQCVSEFNDKFLTDKENNCINRCMTKLKNFTERSSMRFQEEAALEVARQAAQVKLEKAKK